MCIMKQLMICSSCKKQYGSVMNGKYKCYYKTCNDCRHTKNKNNLGKNKHQHLSKTMKMIFQLSQAHNILNLQFQIH